MPSSAAIMFTVAAVIALGGLWLLLQLRKPLPERQVYAYRIAGVMAVSGAAALAISAGFMWSWSSAA